MQNFLRMYTYCSGSQAVLQLVPIYDIRTHTNTRTDRGTMAGRRRDVNKSYTMDNGLSSLSSPDRKRAL